MSRPVARWAPCLAEARGRAVAALGALLLFGACAEHRGETAVFLEIALAPGVAELPDELRVHVRQGSTALFEDQRLPAAGRLEPQAPPDLGSVLLQLGDASGSLTIEVVGLAGGRPMLRGTAMVEAAPDSMTRARLWLNTGEADHEPADAGPVTDGPVLDGAADGAATAPPPATPVQPCRTDVDCTRGAFCLEGACEALRSNGGVCAPDRLDATGNHQCGSGLCADGRCCAQVCGRCQACTGAGGTCQPLVAGQEDPRTDPDRTCQGSRVCDGAGGCKRKNGASCGSGRDCLSGFCTDGVCCDSACNGPCRQCGTGTCTAIVEAVDPPSCSDGRICDGQGECLRVNGRSCLSSRECASGFCVDGVCCNAACNGACRGCESGTCTVRRNTSDRECTGGRRCDGSGVCR